MSNRDWSLVFFTTLAQWSVGIVLCFTWLVFQPWAGSVFDTGSEPDESRCCWRLILIGSATLSSFLHLGNPANAPRALNNLSGSWLSREILAIGVFFASLAVVVVLVKRDWSLVFFTILAQWSVGIILGFTWLLFQNFPETPIIDTGLRFTNPVVLALVFISSATLGSFLHLGKPSNAPRALNNLSSSWLSREILAIGVFFASLLIILIIGRTTGNARALKYPMLVGSFCGLALLWMMIRIYIMPTIPAWNSWYTPVSFVATAVCLGLLTFLAMHIAGWVDITGRTVPELSYALVVVLLIETVSAISHQFKLTKLDGGIDRPVFDRGVFYRIFLWRMAMLIIACLALITLSLNPDLLPGSMRPVYLYPLLGLVIAQEVMGRLLFYSSYFRLGV